MPETVDVDRLLRVDLWMLYEKRSIEGGHSDYDTVQVAQPRLTVHHDHVARVQVAMIDAVRVQKTDRLQHLAAVRGHVFQR